MRASRSMSIDLSGRWLRASAVLALAGATLGFLLDAIHTHTGTTAYTRPVFFEAAWWVPPLFAFAGLAIGLARPLWERLLRRPSPAPAASTVALAMGGFILAYALSGVLPGEWPLRALALGALFLASYLAFDRSGLGLFLAASTAVLGTAAEMAQIHLGLFRYLHPSLDVVAAWLPLLYANAAVGVGLWGKRLVDGG